MVLVSYPESVIQGVNCRLEVFWYLSGENKKSGLLFANILGFVAFYIYSAALLGFNVFKLSLFVNPLQYHIEG